MGVQRRASSGSSFAGRAAGREAPRRGEGATELYHGKTGLAIRTFNGDRPVCSGILQSDGVFVKRLREEHLLHTPPAIAIQDDVLQEITARSCHTIRAELVESGRTLLASLDLFMRHSLRVVRGHGAQRALPLKFWQDEGAAALQAALDFGGGPHE